jgi:hypothetical protein
MRTGPARVVAGSALLAALLVAAPASGQTAEARSGSVAAAAEAALSAAADDRGPGSGGPGSSGPGGGGPGNSGPGAAASGPGPGAGGGGDGSGHAGDHGGRREGGPGEAERTVHGGDDPAGDVGQGERPAPGAVAPGQEQATPTTTAQAAADVQGAPAAEAISLAAALRVGGGSLLLVALLVAGFRSRAWLLRDVRGPGGNPLDRGA